MRDISGLSTDFIIQDVQVPKAVNLFQVQIGSLEYAPTFGIDLRFFINPDLQFQNESFKSYLIQRLAENHVNVNQVLDQVFEFYEKYTFVVGDPESVTGGFFR